MSKPVLRQVIRITDEITPQIDPKKKYKKTLTQNRKGGKREAWKCTEKIVEVSLILQSSSQLVVPSVSKTIQLIIKINLFLKHEKLSIFTVYET